MRGSHQLPRAALAASWLRDTCWLPSTRSGTQVNLQLGWAGARGILGVQSLRSAQTKADGQGARTDADPLWPSRPGPAFHLGQGLLPSHSWAVPPASAVSNQGGAKGTRAGENFGLPSWPLLEKEMATHSSTLAWRIPMDGGAWWATVHGVAKSQTGRSDFTFTFFHLTSLPLETEVPLERYWLDENTSWV